MFFRVWEGSGTDLRLNYSRKRANSNQLGQAYFGATAELLYYSRHVKALRALGFLEASKVTVSFLSARLMV